MSYSFPSKNDFHFLPVVLHLQNTVGNQADMTLGSIFQRSNIGMNTSMVSLSNPKTEFPEIKSNPGKAHHQNVGS